jgi:hypothetical protein
MAMTNTARELKENVNKMMDLCKRKLGEEVLGDENVDAETIELMRGMFRMCDLALKLTCEQAETIDEMNSKLDKLLETK